MRRGVPHYVGPGILGPDDEGELLRTGNKAEVELRGISAQQIKPRVSILYADVIHGAYSSGQHSRVASRTHRIICSVQLLALPDNRLIPCTVD